MGSYVRVNPPALKAVGTGTEAVADRLTEESLARKVRKPCR